MPISIPSPVRLCSNCVEVLAMGRLLFIERLGGATGLCKRRPQIWPNQSLRRVTFPAYTAAKIDGSTNLFLYQDFEEVSILVLRWHRRYRPSLNW